MSQQHSPGDPRCAEPRDAQAFTARFDRLYSRLARPYDLAVKLLPVWRHWISAALPRIRGPCVLEVSFGTGWLLTRYANNFDTHGVDLNERRAGDVIRDMPPLFDGFGFDVHHEQIGGFGSVHLHVATKQ